MDKRYASGVSNYSSSSSSGGRQKPTRAGESNRAVSSFNSGEERDSEQGDGSGVSDYSPRDYDLPTGECFDSGEEKPYSPTSPQYSSPGSRHVASDYSSIGGNYDDTPDIGLQEAKQSEKRHEFAKVDTSAAFGDIQPANENGRRNMASRDAFSSYLDEAVGAQSEGGLKGFDLWLRGQGPATNKQKRKHASAEFVQFLITQNQSLFKRLEKVEIALALMQSQNAQHEKLETSGCEPKYAQSQHESVAEDDPETEKTESILQRGRLRLAWDICIVACLLVGIIVLLKLPKLLDAVVDLVDQKTKNLRSEQPANCSAGQQHLI